jgi:tartrate/fumarate subfamily iron-sulfur-dependent hydro-lyase beta chain
MARGEGFPLTGREVVLTPPLTEAQMRSLKVGDVVLITGDMFTGRDNVHKHLMKNPPPVDLNGAALYHCGPVMLQEGGKWTVKAAGPTTSIREEPYQADVIKRYGVRAVIGKGGMGQKTSDALKEFGAVYLNAIGGAAQFYARAITSVDGVSLMEFGTPEAMWHLRVKDFPAIVTMDAHGNSLHADVEKASATMLAKLAERFVFGDSHVRTRAAERCEKERRELLERRIEDERVVLGPVVRHVTAAHEGELGNREPREHAGSDRGRRRAHLHRCEARDAGPHQTSDLPQPLVPSHA